MLVPLASRQVDGQQSTQGDAAPKAKAGFDLSRLFDRLDANGDGKLALDEVPEQRRASVERLMKQLDANGDKVLTRDELTDPRSPSRGGQKSPPPSSKPAETVTAGPAAGSALLPALDKDGDGTLSAVEIAAAVAVLQALDKNADGHLSPGELLKAEAKPKAAGESPRIAAFIKRSDKNGDGKLSREEAPKRFQDNFDEFDEDMDEFLNPEELAKALGQIQGK